MKRAAPHWSVSFSLAIVFPIILPVLPRPRPGYPFNKHSEAVAACAGIGARLATRAELDYAFYQVTTTPRAMPGKHTFVLPCARRDSLHGRREILQCIVEFGRNQYTHVSSLLFFLFLFFSSFSSPCILFLLSFSL